MERWHRAEAAQHLGSGGGRRLIVAEVLAAAVVAATSASWTRRGCSGTWRGAECVPALAELLAEYGVSCRARRALSVVVRSERACAQRACVRVGSHAPTEGHRRIHQARRCAATGSGSRAARSTEERWQGGSDSRRNGSMTYTPRHLTDALTIVARLISGGTQRPGRGCPVHQPARWDGSARRHRQRGEDRARERLRQQREAGMRSGRAGRGERPRRRPEPHSGGRTTSRRCCSRLGRVPFGCPPRRGSRSLHGHRARIVRCYVQVGREGPAGYAGVLRHGPLSWRAGCSHGANHTFWASTVPDVDAEGRLVLYRRAADDRRTWHTGACAATTG